MNGTHFAHPKCAITAHQIDHLWKMLESYPREIEISNAMIPTPCFKCEISSKRNKSSSWRIFSNFTFFPNIQTTQIQYRNFLETAKWWIKCQAGQDQEVFYRYQYLLLLDHCLKIIATTVATFTKQKFYNFHIFFQSYHLILVDFWNSCRYIWPVIGHLWPLMTWWPLMTVFWWSNFLFILLWLCMLIRSLYFKWRFSAFGYN